MNPHLILKKFLRKKANKEELTYLLKYIKQNPNTDFSEEIRNEWDDIGLDQYRSNKDYQKIYERINTSISKNKIQRRNNNKVLLKIAASLVILVSATFLVFRLAKFNGDEQVAEVKNVVKYNPAGQKSKIYLPDGSTVLLNAESRLVFPERFDSVRNVQLTGEAYFEVAPDADKPFFVKSENVKTIAIGTEFNVRAYNNENKIHVALTKGKIKVEVTDEDKTSDYLISPGKGISYHKEERMISQSNFSPDATIGWKDGIIYFKDASKEEVFSQLERWYGSEFEFFNEPLDDAWKYTGQFKNESLENVLKSIGSIKKFDYQVDNKRVKIMFHQNLNNMGEKNTS